MSDSVPATLPKAPSGIRGLDDVTGGGLPRGRPTLVCGAAGCGKTLFAIEFLVRGATDFGEPGVFFAFEETAADLAANVRSLGFDLPALVAAKQMRVEHVRVERSEIEETGDYDLEGLFVRLGHAIDTVGAKRVALDTLETLFSGLSNQAIIRAELRRLFRWLKDKGVTAVITAERGDGALTRHGLEEYVSDCVILLDHRVTDQVSTRRLRVVKYRGSVHGTNEYPFLIDETGVTVLPVTSMALQHAASTERVSAGVPKLDAMLGGGYYRQSSVMVSGAAGTGKTSIAASFTHAACARGERTLYLAFEESEAQFVRNMRSIGLDLAPAIAANTLRYRAIRSVHYGLEMHLGTIFKLVREFRPANVVVDPLNSLTHAGAERDVSATLVRLIDFLKVDGITALFTNLTNGQTSNLDVSSIIDTWLLLRDMEMSGERNRVLYLLKSRGMAHSNQVREFLLTAAGVDLQDVYTGPQGVLTGSARLAQEAAEAAARLAREQDVASKERELARRREAFEAKRAALHSEFEAEVEELQRAVAQARGREDELTRSRVAMATSRKAAAEGESDADGR